MPAPLPVSTLSSSMVPVIQIYGPTGTGKTAFLNELASRFRFSMIHLSMSAEAASEARKRVRGAAELNSPVLLLDGPEFYLEPDDVVHCVRQLEQRGGGAIIAATQRADDLVRLGLSPCASFEIASAWRLLSAANPS